MRHWPSELRKNESLESLTVDNVQRDAARARITEQKNKTTNASSSRQRGVKKTVPEKSQCVLKDYKNDGCNCKPATKVSGPTLLPQAKSAKSVKLWKVVRPSSVRSSKKPAAAPVSGSRS